MKKVIFAVSLIFLAITSCADENLTDGSSEVNGKKTKATLLELDWDETPDFEGLDLSQYFAVENLQQDLTRKPTLDLKESIVFLPVTGDSFEEYNRSGLESSILIARKKPKQGCNSCVDCIGFRCKDKNPPKPVLFLSLEAVAEKMTSRLQGQIDSDDRIQEYFVILNKETKMLEYYFVNAVTWSALEGSY